MALEVPLTQVLALYLGHPVFGFSVVLVALLLSSGVGSLLCERLVVSRWQVCALIAGLLALLTGGIFPFVHGTIQLPDFARFPLALMLVVACGLPMGFPLALAVRELGNRIRTMPGPGRRWSGVGRGLACRDDRDDVSGDPLRDCARSDVSRARRRGELSPHGTGARAGF